MPTSHQQPAPRPQITRPKITRTYITATDASNRKTRVHFTVYNATPTQVKALLTASPEIADGEQQQQHVTAPVA